VYAIAKNTTFQGEKYFFHWEMLFFLDKNAFFSP
jgi:hypothetical protein